MIVMIVWLHQFRVRKILMGWARSGRPFGGDVQSPRVVGTTQHGGEERGGHALLLLSSAPLRAGS